MRLGSYRALSRPVAKVEGSEISAGQHSGFCCPPGSTLPVFAVRRRAWRLHTRRRSFPSQGQSGVA